MHILKDYIDMLCKHNILGGTVVTFFPEFSGKYRFCALLNEIVQKIVCKIYVFRNNNCIFYMYVAQKMALLF